MDWYIFIVAEEEIAHVSYREAICQRLNTENITLDSSLYYSLEELPEYMDGENSLIICERALGEFLFQQHREVKLFPISLFSLDEDLRSISNYIFDA